MGNTKYARPLSLVHYCSRLWCISTGALTFHSVVWSNPNRGQNSESNTFMEVDIIHKHDICPLRFLLSTTSTIPFYLYWETTSTYLAMENLFGRLEVYHIHCRSRHYLGSCFSRSSRLVRHRGGEPFVSTDWSNSTFLLYYRRIIVLVCLD